MDTLIERKKRFTPRRIYGGAAPNIPQPKGKMNR